MTETATPSIVPPPPVHHWRCHFCGLVAYDLPVSGSRWVDILIHTYHPTSVSACPECWAAMSASVAERAS